MYNNLSHGAYAYPPTPPIPTPLREYSNIISLCFRASGTPIPILTPFLAILPIKNQIEKAFLTVVANPHPLRVSNMIFEQPPCLSHSFHTTVDAPLPIYVLYDI